MRYHCLLAVLLTLSFAGVMSDRCLTEIAEGRDFSALFVQTLHLDVSDGVDVTWQAARGTTDISIWVTDDVTLSTEEVKDGKFKVKAHLNEGSGSEVSARLCMGLFLLSSALYCIAVDGQKKWAAVFVLALASFFTLGNTQNATNCKLGPTIHIQIATKLVDEMCVNGECRPLLCPLSLNSEYSHIPSNNRIIFLDDHCTIKKPDLWDEWLVYFFGNGTTQDYYGDLDNDGLVNILEYYGTEAFADNFVTIDKTKEITTTTTTTTTPSPNDGNITGTDGQEARRKRNVRKQRATREELQQLLADILERGTSPLEADSDGDLIPDGRERLYNTDPNVPDQIDTDEDNDGLNTLDEQIHNTDPKNGDSDGDGTKDGEEVEQGSNPSNPRDEGKPRDEQDCDQTADIKITVGDHSGSHSERYVFHLGDISHQSPGYGLVGSGTYKLEIGTYIGTIQHIGTNLDSPDYDYVAQLEHVSGNAKVTISDPTGMLGYHGESSYLYSNGKRVTVTVELNCEEGSEDPCCVCSTFKTCRECRASTEPDCFWNINKKICVVEGLLDFELGPCPCDRCQAWFLEESRNLEWKNTLNRELPCPCRVTVGAEEITADQDNPSGRTPAPKWSIDRACTANGEPSCAEYHPGAFGCIRSTDSPNIGSAGQQCCYDSTGAVLGPPHLGAGTPDKEAGTLTNVYDHYQDDVRPFNWCCKDCEEPDTYCPKYIGANGVRGGDVSHCNNK